MNYRKVIFFIFSAVSSLIAAEECSMPIFTHPGDPLLQQKAAEVPLSEIRSKETRAIIDQMFAIARGERTDIEKTVMVGLAAPQIGIGKQIILVDVGVDSVRKDLGQLVAYINPKIVAYSGEKV